MYTADFETTTDPNDCRVWAWAVCEITEGYPVEIGNTLEGFIEFLQTHNDTYFFHNLKFDGEFIVHWLLTHDYTYDEKPKSNSFSTLISKSNKWYQLNICFKHSGKHKNNSVTIKDSLKKLPMSVEQVAKAFNLPINKLAIDYDEYREPGHELTERERDYITNDVRIMAMALDTQFQQGLEKLTIGSDALSSLQSMCEHWATYFPKLSLPMDMEIRRAYRGGWTYVQPRYQADEPHPDRCIKNGIVLDVNSLYPSVMYDRWLPVGEPVHFWGEYEEDSTRPLYIQFLTAHIKLKPDHVPTVQLKNSPYFCPTQYITDSEVMVELAMTSVDLALLFEHYDVTVHSYDGGYKFMRARGLFCEYIDFWMEIKATSTGGLRQLAKLMLNSPYGKFATNPDVTGKEPYLKEDGCVGYEMQDEETRDPVYTPMGAFITAYARDVTIRAAQRNYDRFVYADTDSLHLLGDELPDLDIHPTRLGAWSHEASFSKGKYLRAKTYIERITHIGSSDVNGEMYMMPVDPYNDVKCAGMPDNVKKAVNFTNFKRGNSWPGKLMPKHCPGGIVLLPVDFTLK